MNKTKSVSETLLSKKKPVGKPTTPFKPTATGRTPINTNSSSYSVGSNPPKGYGIGYGALKPGQKSAGYTDKNQEISRTESVIKNRQAQGMDTTSQFSHYKNLTGNDYGVTPSSNYSEDDYRTPLYGETPTGMAPVGQSPQNPSSPQDPANYDSRFSALEKMIQGLIDGNKNTPTQQTPSGQGVYDGTHQFTAPNQGNQIGYTQNNDAMNQTLYKYLNGMWKGGF